MTKGGQLWQQMISPPSLYAAWEKVRKNKGAAGGDGLTISVFGKTAINRLTRLGRALNDGTFSPGPYRKLAIPKPKGGYRPLAIPSLNDRIAHTTLAQTLSPILEPRFERCSFAYRPGKSVQQAVAMVERWRDEGYRHVIEADIVRFFEHVRHDLLLQSLTDALQDTTGTAALLEFVEDSLLQQADILETPGRGLAQGCPSSPLFANLYLDKLDEEVETKGIKLVRFADDFLILCKKEETALKALEKTRNILGELGLDLHDDETGLIDFEKGFSFLGHIFVRSLALKSEPQKTADASAHFLKAAEGYDGQDIVLETKPLSSMDDADTSDEDQSVESTRYDRGPQTLYVLDKKRRLTLHNETVAVTDLTNKTLGTIHHDRISRIEVGPGVRIDQEVLEHCFSNNVTLYFVNGWGEQRARLTGPQDDKPRLQYDHARFAANEECALEIACRIVDARIRNQRTQLFRLNRRQCLDLVTNALARTKRTLRKVPHTDSIAQLRGLEGASGADYWPALGALCEGEGVSFRRTRPATSPLNATVNYLTAMLERDVRSAIQSVGLHPGFGILHSVRDYSEAGVYDLMEPFRAPLTEGLAIYLFNAHRLKREMFEERRDGTIRIALEARRAIIKGYESAVAKRVSISGTKRKLAWRPMMRHQSVSLAKAIRDFDPSLFQPFLMDA